MPKAETITREEKRKALCRRTAKESRQRKKEHKQALEQKFSELYELAKIFPNFNELQQRFREIDTTEKKPARTRKPYELDPKTEKKERNKKASQQCRDRKVLHNKNLVEKINLLESILFPREILDIDPKDLESALPTTHDPIGNQELPSDLKRVQPSLTFRNQSCLPPLDITVEEYPQAPVFSIAP